MTIKTDAQMKGDIQQARKGLLEFAAEHPEHAERIEAIIVRMDRPSSLPPSVTP